MILNNTKVFPARLYGSKEKTGAKIEVFLLRELNKEMKLWDVLVDPARKIRVGNKLYFGNDDLVAEVVDNTTSRGRTIRFLFDGSDEAGPVEVTAFIGKPVEKSKLLKVDGGAPIDIQLMASPARTVRLAFFPLEDPDSTSDYEMTMALHENGVISDMSIEYEDFTVSQKLIALEPMPDACKADAYNR
jgi:hypothetical protein